MSDLRLERAREALEEAAYRFAMAALGHKDISQEALRLQQAALDLFKREAETGSVRVDPSLFGLPAA